jgi:hypothetical protein
MGYLDNTTITVDAILTKKGREKLASGQSLNITQFALGDDEIDYALYDAAHPKGSAYYDASIKATPILEASPDETQVLKYKLVTLPKNTTKIPQVSLNVTTVAAKTTSGQFPITPTTSPAGNKNAGYTAILANKNAGSIIGEGLTSTNTTSTTFLGSNITTTAEVAKGLTFSFIPNSSLTSNVSTTITIFGNETGGSVTIPVTVTYVTPV